MFEPRASGESPLGRTTGAACEHEVPSPDRLEFCRYHTPFEGIANKIFVVTSADGADVPYQGKMKKRAPPTRADYIKIRSAGSKSTEVDLATGYTLPAGEYQGTKCTFAAARSADCPTRRR